MNCEAFLLTLVLLLVLVVPLCAARSPRSRGETSLSTSPIPPFPKDETPTEGTPGHIAAKHPGRYETIRLTGAETDTLAQLIWLKAREEPFDGQQAVAEVVFNRMLSPVFPDTLDEVICQDRQFSAVGNIQLAEPTVAQYIAISTALSGPSVLPVEVVFFDREGRNDNVWGVIGKHVFCYPYRVEGS